MNTLFASAALAAVVAAAGTTVLAGDAVPSSSDKFSIFGQVQDWTIYSDATTGSCLAERTDSFGNAIQMGLTRDREHGYVGVFTTAETDIKSGQEVVIAVDGVLFVGTSTGILSGKLKDGYSGGYVVTNNPNFVTAIAEGRELVAFPERTGSFVVNLDGTKAAIAEIRKCNQTFAG
jgi:hypothetical protein